MFGLKRHKVEAPVEAPVVVFTPPEKPLPMPAKHRTVPIGTYEAVANELGFQPAQLLEEQLLRFLSEEAIPTYDYSKVDAYMAALAEEQDKAWIWRPLREKDKPVGWHWLGRDSKKLGKTYGHGHGSYRDEWSYRPYDKLVPIHILRQVQKIQDRFGDKVLFFVSDYAVPNPDPFIMVTALDVQNIVFGVWDEPKFGTESEE